MIKPLLAYDANLNVLIIKKIYVKDNKVWGEYY